MFFLSILAPILYYMSTLYSRVKTVPVICGLELAFAGSMVPSAIEGYQPFYNALPGGTDFQPAYFGRGSVTFEESNDESAAGISYQQKLTIRFPATDSRRAERIAAICKAKFIKVKMSNGLDFVLGRNDFNQNARPKVAVKADERLAQVEFATISIMPTGYTPNQDSGLPTLIPIDLTD